MDWSTVALSAVVSALISAVVGVGTTLATASSITVRQARAQRAEESRQLVARTVQPFRLALVRYQGGMQAGRQRTPDDSVGQDYIDVSMVLTAADGQGQFRRWRVLRRCRKVFGGQHTELALNYPVTDESSTNEIGGVILLNMLKWSKGNGTDDSTHSLIHRAYMQGPGDPLQRDLAKQLALLAKSR